MFNRIHRKKVICRCTTQSSKFHSIPGNRNTSKIRFITKLYFVRSIFIFFFYDFSKYRLFTKTQLNDLLDFFYFFFLRTIVSPSVRWYFSHINNTYQNTFNQLNKLLLQTIKAIAPRNLVHLTAVTHFKRFYSFLRSTLGLSTVQVSYQYNVPFVCFFIKF